MDADSVNDSLYVRDTDALRDDVVDGLSDPVTVCDVDVVPLADPDAVSVVVAEVVPEVDSDADGDLDGDMVYDCVREMVSVGCNEDVRVAL